MATDHTTPSEETEVEEAAEATHAHEAGRGPTAEEAAAADEEQAAGSGDVGATYREMTERGATVKGEGELP